MLPALKIPEGSSPCPLKFRHGLPDTFLSFGFTDFENEQVEMTVNSTSDKMAGYQTALQSNRANHGGLEKDSEAHVRKNFQKHRRYPLERRWLL